MRGWIDRSTPREKYTEILMTYDCWIGTAQALGIMPLWQGSGLRRRSDLNRCPNPAPSVPL
jgi:hypothetical protein